MVGTISNGVWSKVCFFPFRIPAETNKQIQMESSKNSEYRGMPTPGCITDRPTDRPTNQPKIDRNCRPCYVSNGIIFLFCFGSPKCNRQLYRLIGFVWIIINYSRQSTLSKRERLVGKKKEKIA